MILAAILLATIAADSPSVDVPVHFDTQIVPLLTRSGCNSGACHGAAAGRGGFSLSLLGANPAADYDAIVHAFEGRRIHSLRPEQSLVFAKPTGRLDHGGGEVFDESSDSARLLLSWIRGGAPRGEPRRLSRLVVTPTRAVVTKIPTEVAIRVKASFDDQPPVDVTPFASMQPTDPTSVAMVGTNTARVSRRGDHVVIVRFMHQVVPVQLRVPFDDPTPTGDASKASEGVSFIDREVQRVCDELRIAPAPLADDATFLRRASLDLTGRLPTLEALDVYLKDNRPDKRGLLVDSLLSSEAFVDLWTLRMARQLRLHSLPNDEVGPRVFGEWIREQVAQDVPWDEVARTLVLAEGDSHVVGPANFVRLVADARAHAELVGEAFLGVRLGCANCHDHPLDRWTQDDYHGLAAVFAKLERGREVKWSPRGAVTNLRTQEPAVPRIPGVRDLRDVRDSRYPFAEWLGHEGRRPLARAHVNRVWRLLFGRGLIEPADDLRQTNPATHPELLEQLTDYSLKNEMRLRPLLRLLATSDAYARATASLDDPSYRSTYFAASSRRLLEPEVLADALADVTEVADEFARQPHVRRAVHLLDPQSPAPSLDLLGRCSRVAGCEKPSAGDRGLATQLHLLNGDLINAKLANPTGRLARCIESNDGPASDDSFVREWFLRAWSRRLDEDELTHWKATLASSDPQERRRRYEDFVWSLLNSRDFRENR